MRIAYFTEWDPYSRSGVLKKISAQIIAWQKFGHSVKLFVLFPKSNQTVKLDQQVDVEVFSHFNSRQVTENPSLRLGYLNKALTVPKVTCAIRDYKPDIIYYRQQGPWYPGVGKLLRIAPSAAEANGMRSHQRNWGRFNSLYRALTDRWLLHSIRGAVIVSPDMKRDWKDFPREVRTIPNSMTCKPVPNDRALRNKAPRFVFVGSIVADSLKWHGLDGLFTIAKSLPASTFDVVGISRDQLGNSLVPSNVVFHGALYGEELSQIYNQCDVAIGTLALVRRGMETNSALKVLEYLSFRLPIVIGYRETNDSLNKSDYCLNIPNEVCVSQLTISKIKDFSNIWLNKRIKSDLSYLSSEVVEADRVAFFRDLVEQTHPTQGSQA